MPPILVWLLRLCSAAANTPCTLLILAFSCFCASSCEGVSFFLFLVLEVVPDTDSDPDVWEGLGFDDGESLFPLPGDGVLLGLGLFPTEPGLVGGWPVGVDGLPLFDDRESLFPIRGDCLLPGLGLFPTEPGLVGGWPSGVDGLPGLSDAVGFAPLSTTLILGLGVSVFGASTTPSPLPFVETSGSEGAVLVSFFGFLRFFAL